MSKLFSKKKDKSPVKEENTAVSAAMASNEGIAASSSTANSNSANLVANGGVAAGCSATNSSNAPKQTTKSSGGGLQSRLMNLFTKKSKNKDKQQQ